MKTTKKKISELATYKMLLKISKKIDIVIAKLNRLNKKFDFLEDEHDHDHDHAHEYEMPEYKA